MRLSGTGRMHTPYCLAISSTTSRASGIAIRTARGVDLSFGWVTSRPSRADQIKGVEVVDGPERAEDAEVVGRLDDVEQAGAVDQDAGLVAAFGALDDAAQVVEPKRVESAAVGAVQAVEDVSKAGHGQAASLPYS